MANHDPLVLFEELGRFAFLRGEPLDACKYRKIEKRNAWVRGWHGGQAYQDINRLTDTEKTQGRVQIARIRELL